MRQSRGHIAFVSVVSLTRGAFPCGRATCGRSVQQGSRRTISYGATLRCTTVYASAQAQQRGRTQQETEWNVVHVLENRVACESHRYVVIDVGVTGEKGSLCDAYRYPGMYVKMRRDENTKAAFLAISCAPNVQGVFEFLIKDSDSTSWVSELEIGDPVEMSPVMGKGFPISPNLDLRGYPAIAEDSVPYDLLLFATGSGIAPIRASIESFLNGLNLAQRRTVKLYYGTQFPQRMAFTDRFALWREDGVEVIPVMSQPELSADLWQGRTGYVQDALAEDGVEAPQQTGALLCGHRGMTEDVAKVLAEAGVDEKRILMNF